MRSLNIRQMRVKEGEAGVRGVLITYLYATVLGNEIAEN